MGSRTRSGKESGAIDAQSSDGGGPFPWDALRGGTLKEILKDLGVSHTGSKESMLQYIHNVQSVGLESAKTLLKGPSVTQKRARATDIETGPNGSSSSKLGPAKKRRRTDSTPEEQDSSSLQSEANDENIEDEEAESQEPVPASASPVPEVALTQQRRRRGRPKMAANAPSESSASTSASAPVLRSHVAQESSSAPKYNTRFKGTKKPETYRKRNSISTSSSRETAKAKGKAKEVVDADAFLPAVIEPFADQGKQMKLENLGVEVDMVVDLYVFDDEPQEHGSYDHSSASADPDADAGGDDAYNLSQHEMPTYQPKASTSASTSRPSRQLPERTKNKETTVQLPKTTRGRPPKADASESEAEASPSTPTPEVPRRATRSSPRKPKAELASLVKPSSEAKATRRSIKVAAESTGSSSQGPSSKPRTSRGAAQLGSGASMKVGPPPKGVGKVFSSSKPASQRISTIRDKPPSQLMSCVEVPTLSPAQRAEFKSLPSPTPEASEELVAERGEPGAAIPSPGSQSQLGGDLDADGSDDEGHQHNEVAHHQDEPVAPLSDNSSSDLQAVLDAAFQNNHESTPEGTSTPGSEILMAVDMAPKVSEAGGSSNNTLAPTAPQHDTGVNSKTSSSPAQVSRDEPEERSIDTVKTVTVASSTTHSTVKESLPWISTSVAGTSDIPLNGQQETSTPASAFSSPFAQPFAPQNGLTSGQAPRRVEWGSSLSAQRLARSSTLPGSPVVGSGSFEAQFQSPTMFGQTPSYFPSTHYQVQGWPPGPQPQPTAVEKEGDQGQQHDGAKQEGTR